MRRHQQSGDGRDSAAWQALPAPGAAVPPVPAGAPRSLLALQRSAGNAAATQALRGGREGVARPAVQRRAVAPPAPIDERTEAGLVLPPYLSALESGGLSTAYGLTGHEFVGNAVAAAVGHAGEAVTGITADLAARPETFFGQGRAFAVRGVRGQEWFDVTVTITPAPDDRPPVYHPASGLAAAPPDPNGAPLAAVDDAEGKDTKVDVQHNTSAGVGSTTGASSSVGAGGMGFGLAPVAPAVWLGGAATAHLQPWQSGRESRGHKSVAEPRVLRSDKGSVEAPRKVRYGVRVHRHGTPHAQIFHGSGTLIQRVPTEHLVPAGTDAPGAPRPLAPDTARRVSLADSMAAVGVAGTAAPHQGGGGLFDAVASVLHPSLTAPGAPGRARLYEATAAATVLEDMPRLLRDGVTGEDLKAKDGFTAGSYRLHAEITGLVPAWATGGTQLRTHQQAQSSTAATAGKGRAVAGGAGPAIGVGAAGNAAVVRATAMPVAAARKARFTVAEQTVSSRKGAEVRGEKVLYSGTVRFTAEGTGPRSAGMVLDPGRRVAVHTMKVWMSLRADEAAALGLPLPTGVSAEEFVKKPKRTGADGIEQDVERHLPFGGMGSSVSLSRLDTGPMVKAVRELFATDPRLAGYLPAFGATLPVPRADEEEAAVQRHNHRELMAALSETNLRVNKDQLLSTGIRVRLRRKSTLHAHDVQLHVKGVLRETGYLGDTEDWLVRSHSGVASNSQSGRSSSRSIGGLVLGQARLVPGVLTGSARYEKHRTSTRRNQAGPTTRSDVVTNGSQDAAVFGAALSLDVNVTMTSRPRKLARALTPGAPGRDAPQARTMAGLHLGEQDVRLLTPTEFTLDEAGRSRQDAVAGSRRAKAPAPEYDVAAAGIGDLAALTPRPSTGRALRDWQLVETVGDGQGIRDLAFTLLSRAAARNKGTRQDPALATEGLAPRLAIEEQFSPQAITASLRQAASSGWVVRNLRHPRRLAALEGAVGTRLTLANPKFLHQAEGPGTETFVLGGHQASGQRGQGVTSSVQAGATGSENGPEWRTGQGLSAHRTKSEGDSVSAAVAGTVERNAHTPRKAPLYLVQCDLLVNMVAEVAVLGGGPYVAKAARTLPAEAAVWLTEEQLPPSIRRQLKLDARPEKTPSPPPQKNRPENSRPGAEPAGRAPERIQGTDADAARTSSSATTAPVRPGPTLGQHVPLGFGRIENLPDVVPLLARLRENLVRSGRKDLAADLLPRQQLKDPHDNVQRLLRVLDRDGAAALLSGAMDGGVTVELFDGRKTPYWAVFRVDRVQDATFAGAADDGRDMEYITSAVTQRAAAHDTGVTKGVEGVFAGSGKPDAGGGQLKSLGGAAGLGIASATSHRDGTADRAQLGMKTVAEAKTARSVKMRVPVRASLELHRGGRRIALARMDALALTHRVLEQDLAALARVTAPRPDALIAARGARDAGPAGLGPWHAGGFRLPMEAQVNGFHGAPQVRELVSAAIRRAGGGDRFHDTGQAAAYTLREAVSTEWLIAALPLLTSAGADLPPVHASGAEGQDLRASVHARLRAGRVLGTGDKMTFETVGQSHLEAPRPVQNDGNTSTGNGRAARGLAGAGLLNAEEFRLNQLMGNAGGAGGSVDTAGNSSGSMPLHKPKSASVLAQFTLDVRVVARVTNRVRSTRNTTAVQELTLPHPVIIRMPAPAARRMLAAQGAHLEDPDDHLGLRATAPAGPPATEN